MDQAAAGRDEDLSYSYKPSLLGAPWQFWLRPAALEWQTGRLQGVVPYARIARVRLSYRPSSMQNRRFFAEVWPAGGPRLPIASCSWRSMVEQENLERAYGAFIRELHRRIAAAGGEPVLQAGASALLYWPGLVIVTGAVVAIAALTVRALMLGEWAGAAIVAGFFVLFVWQGVTFFYRNRPGSYRVQAMPERLLPGP